MSSKPKTLPGTRRYRVLTDRLTYYPMKGGVVIRDERIRPGKGAVVDDLAPSSVEWLIEADAIEEVK